MLDFTSRFRLPNHQKTRPANTQAKEHNSCSKVEQKLPNGGPKIPPKSIEIQAWNPKVSFRVLPSPPASLDGPQGAKLGATSMPNDTFWAPNLTESAPIFAMNLKTRDVETASRHQRASTHFSRDISKNIQQTTVPAVRKDETQVGATAPTPPYGGGLPPPTPPIMVGAGAPTPPYSRPGGLPIGH